MTDTKTPLEKAEEESAEAWKRANEEIEKLDKAGELDSEEEEVVD